MKLQGWLVSFLTLALIFQNCLIYKEHRLDPDKLESNLALLLKVALTPLHNFYTTSGQIEFSPPPGQYNSPLKVFFHGAVDGYETIHYTLDGSEPTPNSPMYTEPIPIYRLAGRTIKAIIVNSQNGISEVFSPNGYYSIPPIKTTQSNCYDGNGNTISCSGSGQDGEFQKGSLESYIQSSNNNIIQHSDYLYWTTCTYGQGNYPCSGTETQATLSNAANICNSLNLEGKNWRIPNLYELLSLVYYGSGQTPKLNISYFPSVTYPIHWTTSIVQNNPTHAWLVNINNGSITSGNTNGTNVFKCVSGEEYFPATNFQDLGNGSVKDHATGLIWQKCSVGQSLPNCSGTATTVLWTSSFLQCQNLNISNYAGRNDWRLPNAHELLSLLRIQQFPPYLDNSVFPNTPIGSYWTSTTYVENSVSAWSIDFGNGTIGPVSKSNTYRIRCVAGP